MNNCPDGGHCLNEDALARALAVEALAREMAARLIGLSLRGNPKGVAYCALCMEDWNSPHADDCPIARASALGLLEQTCPD